MREKIINLIIAEANEVNKNLKKPIPVEAGADAPLFGGGGVLNSVGLVTLVVAVEQSVEDEFGCSVILANEKAVSQRNSPFRTVGTLADYIMTLLKEE
jgi:acyl carrier protein